MSTAKQVETAWEPVWAAAAIKDYTTKIYKYEVTQDSEVEIEKLLYQQEINFIQVLTTRASRFEMAQAVVYTYTVDIQYVRSKDTTGATWALVRDFFETLWDRVRADLSADWGATVDYWQPQDAPAEITEGEIAQEKVWIGKFQFAASKQV